MKCGLDDANVFRYGQYLQNLLKNASSLSLPTVRGTEHADVLYG